MVATACCLKVPLLRYDTNMLNCRLIYVTGSLRGLYVVPKGDHTNTTLMRYLADNIVAAEPVLVHDGDDDGGLSQHMGGHVEGEGFVEDGVQTALHCHCLFLLYTLVLVHQPHLHIWICNVDAEYSGLHESEDEDARAR